MLQRGGKLQKRRQQNGLGTRTEPLPKGEKREQIPHPEPLRRDGQKPGMARRQRQIEQNAPAPRNAAVHPLRVHGFPCMRQTRSTAKRFTGKTDRFSISTVQVNGTSRRALSSGRRTETENPRRAQRRTGEQGRRRPERNSRHSKRRHAV